MNISKLALALLAVGAAGSSFAGTSSDTLVVYFSASGNTQKVAEVIAQDRRADIFELKPAVQYSQEDLDYRNPKSRSSKEHEDPSIIPEYVGDVSDWGSYKTVYIGYPIWWGLAPNIVYGFVSKHDFAGKTVIPFSTSHSSGHGESGADLARKAGAGDWNSGVGFNSQPLAAEILEKLGSAKTEK